MDVQFREFDPFDCWFWMRFPHPPGQGERQYVEELFNSWYYLGRLGAFNAENLQVHEEGADVSWMAYDNEDAENSLQALMHNMGEVEYKEDWGRVWLDLGTSDGLAVDMLINALRCLNRDLVEISELRVGGMNEDWPAEAGDERFYEE
jgi:hypothetical protein|tara:strand:- start:468 stop:911 length:444 start_codon:yes stop_codon:yes gene_type:complete